MPNIKLKHLCFCPMTHAEHVDSNGNNAIYTQEVYQEYVTRRPDMNGIQDGPCARARTCLTTILLTLPLLLNAATVLAERDLSGKTSSLSARIFKRQLQRAETGDAKAQLEVAQRLATGKGAPQNVEQAYIWYLRAAKQGLAEAQYRTAEMLESGTGVEKDLAQARRWYTSAKLLGHPLAETRLIRMDKAEQEAKLAAKRAALARAKDQERRRAERRAEQQTRSLAAMAAKRAAEQEARTRSALASTRMAEQQVKMRATQRAQEKHQPEEAARRRPTQTITPERLLTWVRHANWSIEDAAVDFLPSALNRCIGQGKKLSCFSSEREVLVGQKSIRYMAQSTIEPASEGRLIINCRFQVTRVRGANDELEMHHGPDHPMPEKGWQSPLRYQCRFADNSTLACSNDQGKQFRLAADTLMKTTVQGSGQ
ncbi:MAG TPA: sel1 repeat family protein [Gammaproteobacteria bacterium]|nr:sel1 repeat family protein [Gammaproteobacteria bacterium]